MALFPSTVVNKGIASLFGRRVSRNDLLKKDPHSEDDNFQTQIAVEPPKMPEPDAEPVTIRDSENIKPADIEDEYVRKVAHKMGIKPESETVDAQGSSPDDEDDTSSEAEAREAPEDPVAGPSRNDTAAKDTNFDDLEHTVFVKNVPVSVITDRQDFKEFKKLFGPEIKSVRFRSIAMSEMVPRKVAFVKHKLHPARDAVNSYIVYKRKERVNEAVSALNGHEFKGLHLFVDSAAHPRVQDSRRSVFVGNLPFEATEENLYAHFSDCGKIDNLRIVRDRKYNLGKGFAYVQFDDVSIVQVALLKDGQDFAGRVLRVTRCSAKAQKKNKKVSTNANAPKHKSDKPFHQKQTERSRRGKPKAQSKSGASPSGSANMVLEGERAKEGAAVGLGRKRKARHESSARKKTRRA